MQVTEVRVEQVESGCRNERLLGYASICFDDCLVVKDIKIIQGMRGLFVAFPQKKKTIPCSKCRCKNYVLAYYCNGCGLRLEGPPEYAEGESLKLYCDVAHPISSDCRSMVQRAVLGAYNEMMRDGLHELGYNLLEEDHAQSPRLRCV